MLLVISPAKKLDYNTKKFIEPLTQPRMLADAEELITQLRKYKPDEIGRLMNLSASLAQLNYERFQLWHRPFTPENAKQALLAFRGDVYQGMDVDSFTENDFLHAQKSLRILSGLYGVLRPMDLMQPYRLEMGTKMQNPRGTNLYAFWGDKITKTLNSDMEKLGHGVLVNLASNEYFKAIDKKKLKGHLLTPVFKEEKDGALKTIGIYAKRARGLITRFIIRHRPQNVEELKAFEEGGYAFSPRHSDEHHYVFVR